MRGHECLLNYAVGSCPTTLAYVCDCAVSLRGRNLSVSVLHSLPTVTGTPCVGMLYRDTFSPRLQLHPPPTTDERSTAL